MTRSVVPIAHLNRRLPELGRLKFGVKTDRAMKTIDNWRVVSKHPDALADIARLCGGKVKDYSDPKSDLTHEVLTTSPTIKVGIPTLGHDLIDVCYELWSGGGIDRRCDGVTAQRWQNGPDGPELVDTACLCDAKGELECKLKVRISFFLPGVSRFGVWRLETSSWNAQAEMVGMAELLQSLAARGITEADLRLDKRTEMRAGQKRNFIVPVIDLAENVEALASGGARMALGDGNGTPAIGNGTEAAPEPPPEITAAPEPEPQQSLNDMIDEARAAHADDEVVDAVVVGEYPDGWADKAGPDKAKATKAARKIAETHGLPVPTSFDEIDADLALATVAEMAS